MVTYTMCFSRKNAPYFIEIAIPNIYDLSISIQQTILRAIEDLIINFWPDINRKNIRYTG